MDAKTRVSRRGRRASGAWSFVVAAVGMTVGCNSSVTSNAISEDPLRFGSPLVSTSSRFDDLRPQLSNDGTRVIFQSGRDGTDKAPTYKIYKADWPVGQAPGAAARLTTSDLGLEQSARLAPSGAWVAFVATNAGVSTLYLQGWSAQGGSTSVVSDRTTTKTSVAFSPDSKLLAWVQSDGTKGTAVAMVVAVGDGSATSLSTANQVQASATGDMIDHLLWLPAASGSYTLATAVSSGAGAVNYKTVTFASTADLASATAKTWLSKIYASITIPPVAAGDRALIIRRSQAGETTSTPKIGTAVESPTPSILVNSEPSFAALTGTPTPTRYATPPGFDVLSAALSTDGKTAFLLERLYYRCAEDSSDGIGAALGVANADTSSNSVSYYVPRLAKPVLGQSPAALSFEVATGVCDRTRSDGSKAKVDDRIFALSVNGAATATSFRAAYVTRFTTHYDGKCALVDGDQEIMALEVSATGKTINALSKNAATIADGDRSGQEPCSL